MPIYNSDMACIFNKLADLPEINDANPFRVRADLNAAWTAEDQPQSVAKFDDVVELLELKAEMSKL